ncbi:hypothetical protein GCM10008023_25440 [Sphingomonas glacialis]|uniref:Uncharacterized protein n=1 Tax=Sphingomonas glacialis TaxID=658225 RepID=A0ABQ3LP35_9SPHN|nr:hypothetical protein GCM10008023_25440 [Sphingomonas glacialis]
MGAAGLASPPGRAYLLAMNFLRYISPLRAWRDMRTYIVTRRPHQLGFMGLALALTYVMVVGVIYESKIPPKPYHRDIIYVQQWRADRTDAEIIAQQKIDGVEQTRQANELKRLEAERRAQFKKVNDGLKAYGI